jgi:prevent-host-death family protein
VNVHTINSEQARTQWRELLDIASRGDVDIVINRHGKPTAAVISYEAYQAVQNLLENFREIETTRGQGRRMADLLEELAQLANRSTDMDGVEWQIEQRKDRSLPGRNL